MSEHVLPPLLTEERVRELRDQAADWPNGQSMIPQDQLSALCDAWLASRKQREGDTRQCTCHPDDNPPVPCPRKYALSECRQAALSPADVPLPPSAGEE